jgi:hypothetical protein
MIIVYILNVMIIKYKGSKIKNGNSDIIMVIVI